MNFFSRNGIQKRHRNAPRIKEKRMGGTLLLPLILLFALIPMVSAWEFDNVKSYDEATKTLTFKNSILGIPTTEIATAKLNTPHINYVITGKDRLVAEFEIDLKEDTYADAFKDMEFINLRNGKTIQRDFKYKYSVPKEQYENVYGKVCKTEQIYDKNISKDRDVTICKIEKTGTKIVYVDDWMPLEKLDLTKGKIKIGIFTDVLQGDNIEWIPTLFGIKSEEWAVWQESYNLGLRTYYKCDETSGTVINDSIGLLNIDPVKGGANFTTGKINNGYRPNAETAESWDWTSQSKNMTVNFWVYQEKLKSAGEYRIFGTFSTAAGDMLIRIEDGGEPTNWMGIFINDGVGHQFNKFNLALNTWYMFTLTTNSSTVATYVNGEHNYSEAFTNGGMVWNNRFSFFGRSDGLTATLVSNTILDEMSFWNRTMTPTDINAIYNSGNGMSYSPATPLTPSISIIYPTTGIYNFPLTHLNISVTANTTPINCFWSNDSGTTNQSISCSGNVTTSSKEGSNTWKVWINDTNGQNNAYVTFTVHTVNPDLKINSPIGTNLLSELLTTPQFTKNLSYNASDTLGLDKCWYYFYEDKNYTDINISIKMDYTISSNSVYCYNFNTNTYSIMSEQMDADPSYMLYFVPWQCIDKSRINLKVQGGLNGFGEGTTKVYDVKINRTNYNLGLINYACENTTSGNLTGCSKAVDQNFTTSADFQGGLFGGTAYLYLNYTLGNYTLLKSCGWNTTAISNISLNKNYTLWLFASDTAGNINSTNTSFIFKFALIQNNISYNGNAYETSRENFGLNFTYNTDLFQLAIANLYYNGTRYSSTRTDIGEGQVVFNSLIYMPLVPSQQNISFLWQVGLVNTTGTYYVNTSLNNQGVNNINLSSCANDGTIAWNITMYDEQTRDRIAFYTYKSTFQYALSTGGGLFKNLSVGNISIDEQHFCIDVNKTYYIRGLIEYSNTSLGYVKKTYSLLDYPISNVTTNLFLYSLLTTSSTSFIMHVQDQALMPVSGYFVYINRWYPELGTYKTVQTIKTNGAGEGVAFLEIEDVTYQFLVYDTNNILVHISEPSVVIPKETPYTIYLTIGEGLPNPISYMGNLTGLTYTLTFDKSTQEVTFIYSDTNTSFSRARLFVTRKNPGGDITICSINNSNPSGVIVCDLTGNSTGQYGAVVYVYRGDQYFVYNLLFEIETFSDYVGLLGVFGAFLILLIAGFAFAYNEVAGIVVMNLAMIFINIIGLVHFGGIFLSAMVGISIIILVVLERG